MFGWVINTEDREQNALVNREQQPCFYITNEHGNEEPIFEVWFWHRLMRRWFCMSTAQDPVMIKHGVVYFWPGDIAGLKRSIVSLGGELRAG